MNAEELISLNYLIASNEVQNIFVSLQNNYFNCKVIFLCLCKGEMLISLYIVVQTTFCFWTDQHFKKNKIIYWAAEVWWSGKSVFAICKYFFFNWEIQLFSFLIIHISLTQNPYCKSSKFCIFISILINNTDLLYFFSYYLNCLLLFHSIMTHNVFFYFLH